MSDPTIEINMTEQATTTLDNKRTHSEMVADATPVQSVSDVPQPDEKRIKLDPTLPNNDGVPSTSSSSTSSSTSTTTTTTTPPTTTTPVAPKPNARAALLSRLQKQATKLETIIAEAPEPTPTPTPTTTTTTTSTNGTSPKVGKKRGRKPKSAKPPSPPPSDDEDAGRARQGRQRRPSNRFNEGGDGGLSTSFQQCNKLLQVIKNHRWAWPFNHPVDPEKLGIPDYFNIIKKPMDLGSVERKLSSGEYQEVQEFADDVNLVWQNCITYNQPGSDVVRMAEELKKIFAEKWSKLKADIESGVFDVAPQAVESPAAPGVTNEVAKTNAAPKAPARQPAPSRKKAPATPDARPMSWDEKKNLSNSIAQLPADKLQRVVDIIQKRAPKASSQSTDTEIEIDLDKLDAITLRTLEKYVDSTLSSKKKGSSTKKKVKKAPVPVMEGTSSATATPATSASVAGEEASAQIKKDQDSESSGGSDDESSDTDSSSDSDSSGSDPESDADSEKRKFLSAVKETDPTSTPQALSSQTNNQAIINVDNNNTRSNDSGASAVNVANKPLDQATAGTTGDVTPTIILPAQPEAVKQEVAIENESGWAMMADSDDEKEEKSSLSEENAAGSAWSDFQSKNSQMKQRQKELEEKRIKDLEDRQRKLEEEVKAKELARIELERKQEEERENAKRERERFEQSQQQKIEDSEFDESMFNM